MRCLSICLVLWHHSPAHSAIESPIMILQRGFVGVDFFFVISGFLITTLLLREESQTGRFSLLAFYWRRVLRILPLYFLTVSLAAFWWIVVLGETHWLELLPYYYFFLANFLDADIPLLSPTWSLSVEEQYYLVWPLLLLLLPSITWLRVGVLMAVTSFMVLVAMDILTNVRLAPSTGVASFYLPVSSYSAILIGSLLAVLLNGPKGFAVFWSLLRHPASPVVWGLVFLACLQWLPMTLTGWPNLILHVVMAMTLCSVVIREDHALAGVLRWPPIVRIGVISYGIYLWHLFARHLGVEFGRTLLDLSRPWSEWAAMPVYLLASLILAELSFRYFESHFLRLKNKSRKTR